MTESNWIIFYIRFLYQKRLTPSQVNKSFVEYYINNKCYFLNNSDVYLQSGKHNKVGYSDLMITECSGNRKGDLPLKKS